jgi:hypothetical protein
MCLTLRNSGNRSWPPALAHDHFPVAFIKQGSVLKDAGANRFGSADC